jgi:hypothetical protein
MKMKVKIVADGTKPVKLVRARKVLGRGITLGEFSNHDGRGIDAATAYARKKGHDVAVVVVDGVRWPQTSHPGDRPAA